MTIIKAKTASSTGTVELERTSLPFPAKIAFGIVAFSYLLVCGHRPIALSLNAGFDDDLYMRSAYQIATGNWLGPYDKLTLAKLPGFPLFLAINYLVGLPIILSLSIIYVISVGYFCAVLRRLLQSDLLCFILFAAVLFAPPLASAATTFVQRDFFYASLVLALLASGVNLSLARVRPISDLGAIALAGTLGGWCWLTREESIWLLPPVAFLAAVSLFASSRAGFRTTLAIWIGAVVTAGLLVSSVGLINRVKYGRFVLSEINSAQFQSAMNALQRASYPDWRPYVPVAAAARRRIYEQSPTFRQMQPMLDPPNGLNGWEATSCETFPQTCGDIGGGWFMWAFRDAADALGKHSSPRAAQEFYGKIASEVNAACAEGRLECARWLPPLAPPFTFSQVQSFPQTLLRAAEAVAMLPPIVAGWVNFAPAQGLGLQFVELTGAAPYGPGRIVVVKGHFRSETTGKVMVRADANAQIIEPGGGGPTNVSATILPETFSIVVGCLSEPCAIAFFNEDQQEASLTLNERDRSEAESFDLGHGVVTVDEVKTSKYTWRTQAANWFNSTLPTLQGVYTALILVGLASLAFSIVVSVVTRTAATLLGVTLTLYVALWVRIGLIAVVDATSFPAIHDAYLSPTRPLAVAASILAMGLVIQLVRRQERCVRTLS
jgi:hypothetical protein